MPRDVAEWIGRSDNSAPSEGCKRRILDRQQNQCALTGVPLVAGSIQFDHRVPLWLGGENRETNLQAVSTEAHGRKTKAEAAVRAKINRQKLKHLGVKAKRGRPIPGSKASGIGKTFDGTVYNRNTGEVL